MTVVSRSADEFDDEWSDEECEYADVARESLSDVSALRFAGVTGVVGACEAKEAEVEDEEEEVNEPDELSPGEGDGEAALHAGMPSSSDRSFNLMIRPREEVRGATGVTGGFEEDEDEVE